MNEPFLIQDQRTRPFMWWKSDRTGYTDNILEAGIYTETEARVQEKSRSSDVAVPLGKFRDNINRLSDALNYGDDD